MPIQSGTLSASGSPIFVHNEDDLIGIPQDYKYYADKPSALEWIKKAMELYNELIPIYDAT